MSKKLAPTVPLILLLTEMGRLKAASKLKDDAAAKHLGCAPSKISRLLGGETKWLPGDAKLLAEFHGAEPELVEVLVDLARNYGQKGDWTAYSDLYSESFRFYADLERHARRLRQAQSEIIPGLMQTVDFRRALQAAPGPFDSSSAHNELAIQAMLARQSILEGEDPPVVAFVLSESCLLAAYGGHAVMRAQLNHLMAIAQRPNVQLQVLPLDPRDGVRGASLNFCVLHVPWHSLLSPLDVVYVEGYDDARYIDDHTKVDKYEELFSSLQAAALGPVDSIEFIGAVADKYYN